MKTKLFIILLCIGFLYSCSKPKYKTRNGGKRITSIKQSGFKKTR